MLQRINRRYPMRRRMHLFKSEIGAITARINRFCATIYNAYTLCIAAVPVPVL